ncbi:MAG: S1 family peptidase [Nostochopsis sp.]
MNLLSKFSLGIIVTTALIFQTRNAVAQTACETNIQNTAEGIAVKIFVQSPTDVTNFIPRGSGVRLKKDENSYYVLTNYHVAEAVKQNSEYSIDDNKIILTPIYPKSGESKESDSWYKDKDIALFQLEASSQLGDTAQKDNVAVLGSSTELKSGTRVCVAGFPIPQENFGEFKTTLQEITSEKPVTEGQFLEYKPLASDNNTESGMSGGPILNPQSQLVGIHKGENQTNKKENRGVPLDTILGAFSEIPGEIIHTPIPNIEPVIILLPPANKPFNYLFPRPVRGSF